MFLPALTIGSLLFAPADRVARRPSPVAIRPQATTITTFIIDTANVAIAATNPTTNPAPFGAETATFVLKSSTAGLTWNMTVRSSASTFSGCTTVPLNAITATCTVTPPSGASGSCGSVALSTVAQTLAGGTENTVGGGGATYTVNITLTLADDWKFLPTTCTAQTLTYLLTAN